MTNHLIVKNKVQCENIHYTCIISGASDFETYLNMDFQTWGFKILRLKMDYYQ